MLVYLHPVDIILLEITFEQYECLFDHKHTCRQRITTKWIIRLGYDYRRSLHWTEQYLSIWRKLTPIAYVRQHKYFLLHVLCLKELIWRLSHILNSTYMAAMMLLRTKNPFWTGKYGKVFHVMEPSRLHGVCHVFNENNTDVFVHAISSWFIWCFKK